MNQHQIKDYSLNYFERWLRIDNKTREYLEIYRREYDSFKVAYELYDGVAWKYFIYPSDKYDEWSGQYKGDNEAEHREIFPDEIIIETDLPYKHTNTIYTKRLCKRLRLNGFSYKKWDSGNKSKHIQLIFPQLLRVYSSDKRKEIKLLFIRWLCGCKRKYINCSYCNGSKKGDDIIDCEVVTKDIDMLLFGKHMIRMEYSIHPKTGRLKVLEEEYRCNEDNVLPQQVIKQFNKRKGKLIFKYKGSKQSTDMMCIHYFLNNSLDDCRQRVCFSVASHLVHSKGAQETRDIIYTWNKKYLNNYIKKGYIEGLIKYILRDTKKTGCKFNKGLLRELNLTSVCNYCQYNKKGETNGE